MIVTLIMIVTMIMIFYFIKKIDITNHGYIAMYIYVSKCSMQIVNFNRTIMNFVVYIHSTSYIL